MDIELRKLNDHNITVRGPEGQDLGAFSGPPLVVGAFLRMQEEAKAHRRDKLQDIMKRAAGLDKISVHAGAFDDMSAAVDAAFKLRDKLVGVIGLPELTRLDEALVKLVERERRALVEDERKAIERVDDELAKETANEHVQGKAKPRALHAALDRLKDDWDSEFERRLLCILDVLVRDYDSRI